ncbi:MAG: MFS transporter [Deferribacteraceae bacterium]|jgi:acyl-[acyl-carrier-protein]-phospholipid O-acyltransferase/long-chain-fatty-acid--[acyl-carrier-protein] ligase|nr:MFS transporter [Deferribacteraceae bacterium]
MSYFFLTRRFLPLFITQFQNAFSDNVFKNAIAILITYRIAADSAQNAALLVTVSSGLFILPFFLFSALAGQIADKYDRAKLARIYKFIEIVVMALGVLAFYTENTWFLLIVLLAMGTQSTFFGPIKYALLPQQLTKDELMMGNAYIEGATFVSILVGTIVGGLLILTENGVLLIGIVLMVAATLGYISSRFILPAPGGSPEIQINRNIFTESYKLVKSVSENRKILYYIMLISWFWLVGSIFLAQTAIFAKEILHADETVITFCLTMFSIGIAIGSVLCSKLSRGKPSLKFVPLGAIGMALFTAILLIVSRDIPVGAAVYGIADFVGVSGAIAVMLSFLGIAIFGGVYTVPLYTMLQMECQKTEIARVIAVTNIINSFGMVASVVVVVLLYAVGFKVTHVFAVMALINIIIGVKVWKGLRNL